MLGTVTGRSARGAFIRRFIASQQYNSMFERTTAANKTTTFDHHTYRKKPPYSRSFSSNQNQNKQGDSSVRKQQLQSHRSKNRRRNRNATDPPSDARQPLSRTTTAPSSSPMSQSTKPKVVLNQFMEALHRIQLRLDEECEPLPHIWMDRVVPDQDNQDQQLLDDDEDDDDNATRNELYQVTRRIVQLILEYTDEHPSAVFQHTHEFTNLLGSVLRVYVQLVTLEASEMNTSIFDNTMMILQRMRNWKLNVQQKHVDCAMEIAARHGQWQTAADIFWNHIDPDQSGYNPYDISLTQPMGLYVTARWAQKQKHSPVQCIMDAVLRMTMVSPGDESKYILAAGTALGLVDEWKDFVHFLRTSDDAARLGQTLNAAVMNACLISGQPEEALKVFDDLVGGDLVIANEWQWGGGQDRLDARCRNLAIRALAESDLPEASHKIFQLFKQALECGDKISGGALFSMFHAFEKEGQWSDSVELLFHLMEISLSDMVSADDLDPSVTRVDTDLFDVLESVIRTCHAAGQFGTAILATRTMHLSISSTALPQLPTTSASSLVQMLAETVCSRTNESNLLATVIATLSGLGCMKEALELYSIVKSNRELELSGELDDFVLFLKKSALTMETPTKLSPWEACYNDIHRVTAAAFQVRKGAAAQKRSLATAIGSTILACNLTSQPHTGITLAKWLNLPLPLAPRSFDQNRDLFDESMYLNDTLLAALMDSFRLTGQANKAIELFESHTKHEASGSRNGLLSTIAAINALFAVNHLQDALSLFHDTLMETRSPELFSSTARGILRAGHFSEVSEMYRLAFSSGCLSEDLTICTLQALDTMNISGKSRILRNMIQEVSQLSNSKPNEWLEFRYWNLKRLISFSNLSFMMWWSDPKTRHLDELDFALEALATHKASGLVPEEDILRFIVKGALQRKIPDQKTGISRVPRDRDAWIDILDQVWQESQNTSVVDEARFIENLARAYSELGDPDMSDDFVARAKAKGFIIDKSSWNVHGTERNSTDNGNLSME